jgi:hypothetical protein
VKKNDLGLFNKKKPSAPGPRRMTPLAGLKIKQVCIGLKSHHHMLGFFFFKKKKWISDMLFSLIFFSKYNG